jgi:integrase
LALRKDDIDPEKNILYVRHSWSSKDLLKSTKNREQRRVPLQPQVKKLLLDLLTENPHNSANPFIFYSSLPDKPMVPGYLLDELKNACDAVGIDHEKRRIVFHSHRHYYAARMVDRMTAEQVSRITGHKSMAVFEEYADHVIDETPNFSARNIEGV